MMTFSRREGAYYCKIFAHKKSWFKLRVHPLIRCSVAVSFTIVVKKHVVYVNSLGFPN